MDADAIPTARLGASGRRALTWIAIALAVGVIAGAVVLAARAQRTTAETNFAEAQIASDMRIAILQQERGLDGYVLDGKATELAAYFSGKQDLETDIGLAANRASDDAIEAGLVRRQDLLAERLVRLSAIELSAAQADRAQVPRVDAGNDRLIDEFLKVNDGYRARLDFNRHREEHRATLLSLWLICGLSALFLGAGWIVVRRTTRLRLGRERAEAVERDEELKVAVSQGQFAEAMQVSESQAEAHEIIARHLEHTIPGSEVLVLNRNNSADRLESAEPLPEGHPLREPLERSHPRSCLAVRLSREFERGGEADEVLTCEICGALGQPSTCRPLLVGGEVIGSVLVTAEGRLEAADRRRLGDSVSLAAPVLANLRNLNLAESRAATDSLTGLPNRRAVDDNLKRLIAQAARTGRPFSVVLLDIDKFKEINDVFGHERGDDVLAAIGALLYGELRASDLAGRSGGEEFLLMLPDTEREGAVELAEKVRLAMHSLRVPGVTRGLSASFGVASFPADAADVPMLLRLADRALYSAKRQGRDRVEAATPGATSGPRLLEVAPSGPSHRVTPELGKEPR